MQGLIVPAPPPITKLSITGTRGFNDYDWLVAECDKFIKECGLQRVIVVSGGARGTDKLAERYAAAREYAFELYKPNWVTRGRIAGLLRNEDMARAVTHGVVFWDGASKGTRHMITLLRRFSRTHRVIHYTPPG